MNYNDVKSLLTETYNTMSNHGVDINSDYRTVLADDALFDTYKSSLAEGLDNTMKEEFMHMSDLVREGIITETVYGFLPQAQLIMPIFRKMWPQSILAA